MSAVSMLREVQPPRKRTKVNRGKFAMRRENDVMKRLGVAPDRWPAAVPEPAKLLR